MSQPCASVTVEAVLKRAGAELSGISDSPGLDARVLLAAALDCSPAWLIAHARDALTVEQLDAFDRALARRQQGEPVAYVLGRREFWSLDLKVSPDTLIPRPDTETLVEVALGLVERIEAPRILDLGTGTGAIALALAHERADASVTATDRSEKALNVAQANARAHGLTARIGFAQGDWFDALDDGATFDLIVSNPPYVRRDDPHLSRGDVRFEPVMALVAGDDGLEEYRRIAPGALNHLRAGGWLAVEHGADQGDEVSALFRRAPLAEVRTVTDLACQPRVTLGRRG
ncbi:MAG: peptide chain release factor N(5)-glutamine methyltransferase [Pseudomonadota bacterium]